MSDDEDDEDSHYGGGSGYDLASAMEVINLQRESEAVKNFIFTKDAKAINFDWTAPLTRERLIARREGSRWRHLSMNGKIKEARLELGMSSADFITPVPSIDGAFPRAPAHSEIPDGPRQPAPAVQLKATPYQWIDPSDIPRREWLYGQSLARRFLTVTVAPGGTGKSSLAIVEALAIATGKPLLGKRVSEIGRVWLWNLEDPFDELQRRVQAAALHHGISADDIGGRLFIDSGRDQPLCTAITGRNGAIIQKPVTDGLVAEMTARGIDVFIVDPFVSSHQVSENDNPAMDIVAKEWSKVADRSNAAIHLVHHTRKLGSDAEVTAESARGAKALTDAAREVRAINRMSAADGAKFGVTNHRSYFRMYSDKANMAPPAELSDWYEIVNTELPNGDHVGVVVKWLPPGPFDDVGIDDLLQIQRALSEGDWREDIRAEKWAGKAVALVLGLDPIEPSAKQQIKTLLHVWIENGALRIDHIVDEKRRKRNVVRVGEWAK